jgi:hypothetical protein
MYILTVLKLIPCYKDLNILLGRLVNQLLVATINRNTRRRRPQGPRGLPARPVHSAKKKQGVFVLP